MQTKTMWFVVLLAIALLLGACAQGQFPSPLVVRETVEVVVTPTPVAVAVATEAPSTPVPTPLVPSEVVNIVQENCVRCHTAMPAEHAEGQIPGQCGQCHAAYPHTVLSKEYRFVKNCLNCHDTPANTHFYLRDDTDQTVLAANANDTCKNCHGFAGKQTLGKGTPPLETEADILAAAALGTLRPWIQTGGFMANYLQGEDQATLTAWIDSISADRELAYDPYLDAVKIESDFEINGRGDNPAWADAPEHLISLVPTIYTAADNIRLKALYSNEYLYIRAEWPDSTASMTRSGSWILDGDAWRHPKAASENDKQSEDRLAFFWNISMPNYKAANGCAAKCHGNVPGSSEFLDTPGQTVDIWHGKAVRGWGLFSATDSGDLVVDAKNESFEVTAGAVDLAGVLDDKRLVWYMDTDDGYDTEDSGRRGDSGGSAYAHNRNKDKSAPLFIETAPDSWADAMMLTETETTDGSAIIADPTDAAYDAAAVDAAWANYTALGEVVPERILRAPKGSRADGVESVHWQDGVWVSEIRRALVTGNPDDVQFDLASAMEYEFSVSVFDNCGRGEIPPGHTTYGDGQYQVLRFQ